MKRQSKKFQPSRWMDYLVPALLILLAIALAATLLVVALSVAGLIPTL